jgi:hypothetical protein
VTDVTGLPYIYLRARVRVKQWKRHMCHRPGPDASNPDLISATKAADRLLTPPQTTGYAYRALSDSRRTRAEDRWRDVFGAGRYPTVIYADRLRRVRSMIVAIPAK